MLITIGSRTFANADALEVLVKHAALQYNATGYAEDFDNVQVTDPEYDALYKTLKMVKPKSDAFDGTTPAQAAPTGAVIKHDPPMTSIDKADGERHEKEDIYNTWISDTRKRLGKAKVELAQEYKHDGNAIRLNYVKGELVSAGTRNRDPKTGTDITEHAKYIIGVPTKLKLPLTLSLNGEIECWLADLEEINKQCDADGEEPYKNPRNYTAGVLGRDDPKEVKGSKLRVTFYSITGFDDAHKYYKTIVERAKWANSKEGLGLQDDSGKGFFVRSMIHSGMDQLDHMEQHAKKLPYYVDGVVLKVLNIEDFEEVGHSGDDDAKNPRGALAWKFEEEQAKATTKELEWKASRTGRVVPTAVFVDAVSLHDTMVSRATVNNYGWAKKMGVGAGTIVNIKKAGGIIPNVCSVVSGEVTDIGAPKVCPTCGGTLELFTSNSGNTDLLCKNTDCAAKHIHSWVFFLTQMGCKGLGTSAMEKILATGRVRSIDHLFDLEENDLTTAGFSERQATLALATIWRVPPGKDKDNDKLKGAIVEAKKGKMVVEAAKFFKALGIPGAGDTVGKALVGHYKAFDPIRTASEDDLKQVAGIGPVTAKSIVGWFQSNDRMVGILLQKVKLELPKSGKLNDKNFCLTGTFTLGKKHWEEKIKNQGGNIQSSVGKATNYLVQEHGKSDGTPSDKEEKAAKHGTEVISVAQLEAMV